MKHLWTVTFLIWLKLNLKVKVYMWETKISRSTASCDLWFWSYEVMKFRPQGLFSVSGQPKYTYLGQFWSYYHDFDRFGKLWAHNSGTRGHRKLCFKIFWLLPYPNPKKKFQPNLNIFSKASSGAKLVPGAEYRTEGNHVRSCCCFSQVSWVYLFLV